MFGLLNTTQIYGIQTHRQEHEQQKFEIAYQTATKYSSTSATTNTFPSAVTSSSSNTSTFYNNITRHCRSSSSITDTTDANLTQTKTSTNFLEKLLKTDLLNTYDTLKNYRSNASSTSSSHCHRNKRHSDPLHQQHRSQQHQEGILNSFNCLHGSYRHSFDGEFYEKIHVSSKSNSINSTTKHTPKFDSSEMTIKCSKNLLAIEPEVQGPATLQNYQKIPESEHDLLVDSLVASSGASSGEFNSSSDATTNTQSSINSGSGSGGGNGSSTFSSSSSNLYKRLSFGGRSTQNSQKQEQTMDNTQALKQQQQKGVSSNSVALSLTAALMPSLKVIDLHRSSSSTSSSGDFLSKRERKKGTMTPQPEKTPLAQLLSLSSSASSKSLSSQTASTPTPTTNVSAATAISSTSLSSSSSSSNEKSQRRKLLQMLTAYEQQNKLLQRELGKEKRRRSEELACVVKSLLCFESKLKTDMKGVNQRLQEKDVEICRLVRQNRALRKKLCQLQKEASDSARDEGVVEDDEVENEMEEKNLLDVDCLQMEALQCINCQRQFYDIEVQENFTQTPGIPMGWDGKGDDMAGGGGSGSGLLGRSPGMVGNANGCLKEASGSRNNHDPPNEHGSSSDDTVSSSFFGARRSVRYTSKRTTGTFRDYMRSRAMNIDDPSLEADDNNSEEYPSTISRDDSSHEKLQIFSRTIERMHGVKCESERDSEHSGLDTSSSSVTRSNSRASTKSSKSSASSKASELSCNAMEEDDGIFSPTQDDEFEEDEAAAERTKLQVVRGRALEAFSEASPKQIYETSTDDWYASASDQEEISSNAVVSSKSYGQGAVNPVLECVNQILLQQSMEGIEDRSQTPKNSTNTLPRRSSLSDRRNNRNNSRASDGSDLSSRNGTLTRKRVHFSTKNSMVHVPRNDETEEENEEDDEEGNVEARRKMISNYQGMVASSYIGHSPSSNTLDKSKGTEHLEVLNYESIYSNEYEPIGSELNSSNLYVDMEAAVKPLSDSAGGGGMVGKQNKLPPALPPKPANLLKFKKSLHQLDESPDEQMEAQNNEVLVEPDYCSISEVNLGITSVQIRADVHRAPLSERDLESVLENDNDLETATVVSEALSQKTEEIEEIFADIPKLPNVAAIIAPKSALKQNDYLLMAPKSDAKVEVGIKALQSNTTNLSPNAKPDRSGLKLNLSSSCNPLTSSTPLKSPKMDSTAIVGRLLPTSALHCSAATNYQQQQYKRKHMPNILQEINKRLSLPNSPITPTAPPTCGGGRLGNGFNKSLSSINDNESPMQVLPLQAEFDWYNLDAEYGKNSSSQGSEHSSKVCDILGNGMSSILADIKEDGESLINTADEYNLDEEYNNDLEEQHNRTEYGKHFADSRSSLCEAINPSVKIGGQHQQVKAKKIKKNLANFEKFIENTTVNGKPLPSKRKIYFAGPFV